jgi:hypothetical protein
MNLFKAIGKSLVTKEVYWRDKVSYVWWLYSKTDEPVQVLSIKDGERFGLIGRVNRSHELSTQWGFKTTDPEKITCVLPIFDQTKDATVPFKRREFWKFYPPVNWPGGSATD